MATDKQTDAFDRAIAAIGSVSQAAERLGYKTAWGLAKYGKVIPSDKVIQFAELSGWKATPHELRPDLYPHPDDGLPAELRSQVAA